jgi:hypothetical protein
MAVGQKLLNAVGGIAFLNGGTDYDQNKKDSYLHRSYTIRYFSRYLKINTVSILYPFQSFLSSNLTSSSPKLGHYVRNKKMFPLFTYVMMLEPIHALKLRQVLGSV